MQEVYSIPYSDRVEDFISAATWSVEVVRRDAWRIRACIAGSYNCGLNLVSA